MMNGKGHSVSAPQGHDFRSGLHPRTLLGQHELPTGKFFSRLGQQDCHLYGKYVLAIQILMQAVIVGFAVLQEQRRGLILSGGVTSVEELLVPFGIAHVDFHGFIPAIGNDGKFGIECCPQMRDEARQRVSKILVLPFTETVPRHHHPASKLGIVRIRCRHFPALIRS
jgi:hypothetical protein